MKEASLDLFDVLFPRAVPVLIIRGTEGENPFLF